jgi:hypothetical protein
MRQEGVDLRLAHLGRRPDILEEDEALDPVAVRLLGPAAVVTGAEGVTQTVEELGLAVERADVGRDRNER